jgi:hypothetical protein
MRRLIALFLALPLLCFAAGPSVAPFSAQQRSDGHCSRYHDQRQHQGSPCRWRPAPSASRALAL